MGTPTARSSCCLIQWAYTWPAVNLDAASTVAKYITATTVTMTRRLQGFAAVSGPSTVSLSCYTNSARTGNPV